MEECGGQESVRKDLQHFQRVLLDPALADNVLLPHMQRLLVLARNLECNCGKLASKNEQMTAQLAEFNYSLKLATRIDPLTRLANRRDIMERLIREESRSQRHWRAFSLILVDIDDFKQLIDVHGRNAADELLVEIACELQGCVRSEDICGRWGGDEFMLILPETTLGGAVAVAEKIVKSVAMTEFRVDRPGIRTTVSLGLGEYRPDHNVYEFLASLDRGVQQAKQEGKNRYVVI